MRRPPTAPLVVLAVAWLATAGADPARTQAPAARTAAVLFTPPACAAAPFSDVPTSHDLCAWIQQLAQDGISAGCGGGRYCPDAPLTRAQAAMLVERAMRGTDSWDPWRGLFQRILVVSPVPGDEAASGARLLDLLAGVTDASSSNRVLLWLEPGVYDLGTAQLQMKPHVTIQGASRATVEVKTSRSLWGAVGAVGASMRSLVFRNSHTFLEVHGVDLATAGSLADVEVRVSGGATSIAVQTQTSLVGVTGFASASSAATGILVVDGAVTLSRVTGSTSGAERQRGIHVDAGADDVLIEHSEATTHLADLQGFAIYVTQEDPQDSVRLNDVTARALGSADDAPLLAGLHVIDGRVVVERSRLEAGSSANAGFGLSCDGALPDTRIDVLNSRLIGPDATVQASDPDCTVRIGGSQLQGGAVDDGGGVGDVRCVALYGDGFTSPGINDCF